jgi:hypothetical protein
MPILPWSSRDTGNEAAIERLGNVFVRSDFSFAHHPDANRGFGRLPNFDPLSSSANPKKSKRGIVPEEGNKDRDYVWEQKLPCASLSVMNEMLQS